MWPDGHGPSSFSQTRTKCLASFVFSGTERACKRSRPAMETPPVERQPPERGCNLFALLVVAVLALVFAIAAWVRSPGEAPQPIDTGVPASAPDSSQRPL